ncbi:substrate-binding domain-containing protein [Bifidobacterium simiiventris]|uniref:substrate-binding domain-containing protein n=1 Tax=Bifidobacterium simiiventris TaxID=2834434 RepID=UPI001C56FBFC|nr:substrate-binding domain-containing protein [Bifidobacterium simiiventris]MBW3077948.1 DeoR/GlpR family transcriptional regulator [Bifidobacterium simiiventris]
MTVLTETATGTSAAGATGTDEKKYLPAERQDIILGMLSRGIVVRVDELAKTLDTTPITVRRDLNTLANAGLIRRVRGGATALGDDTQIADFSGDAASAPPSPVRQSAASRANRPSAAVASLSSLPLQPSASAIPPLSSPQASRFADAQSHGMTPTLSGTIGVMFPEPSFNWPVTSQAIDKEAAAHDLGVETRSTTYDNGDEIAIVEDLLSDSSVIGLILAPSVRMQGSDIWQWLKDAPVPVVLAEREPPFGVDGLDIVMTDYRTGVRQVIDRFVALGHRRLGLALTHTPVSDYIEDCWRSVTKRLDTVDSAFVRTNVAPYDSVGVESVAKQAIDEGTTAMLVHSDWLAMSLAQTLERHGVAMPADLSMISVDGYITPNSRPLTAMRSVHRELGRVSVDLLISRYLHPERPARRVMVAPEFVERGSLAPAR